MLDLIVRKGTVVDGSGGAGVRQDVGVRGGRIAVLGDLAGAPAETVLEAQDRVVAPGFIDLHTHCRPASNLNYLQQGVTLVVGGNCGFVDPGPEAFAAAARGGFLGPSMAVMTGHNSIRNEVLGAGADRAPTADEMARMKQRIGQDMAAGAVGFSTGLAYVPGTFATTEEVVELAREAARWGGYYSSHMRNEGARVLEAIEETLRVGRQTSLPVHISHHKIAGVAYHGASTRTLELIERARREGLDVTLDVYPYAASCGRIGLLLPAWAQAGDEAAVALRLGDPQLRERMRGEVAARLQENYGGDASRVTLAACAKDRSLEGRTLASLAQERCGSASVSDAAETVLAIAALDHPASSRTMCVYHSISEEDVRRIMSYPHTMIASDGWGDDRAMGSPHPRCYGTFPRVLGVYCRDVGLLPLETAVHKMTGQPAARLALPDRGVLRVGAVADLVVFDPVTVADKATFDNPKQYPAGIDYVVVNGVVTIARSEHMGALPGVFVPRPAGENGESGT